MTTPTHTVPIDKLVPNEQNPRGAIDLSADSFKELVASVKRHGVLQPLLVKQSESGDYMIVAGHRRYEAARVAKLKTLPVYEPEGMNGGSMAAALTENVMREDLTPIEEARALEDLRKAGKLKQADLAKQVGKSPAWVSERLRLLKLPAIAQEAVHTGGISLDAAQTVQGLAKQSKELADAVVVAATESDTVKDLTRPQVLGSIVQALSRAKGGPYLAPMYGVGLKHVVDNERRAKLKERHEAIDLRDWNKGLGFGPEDVDAARAYGCLVEVDRYGNGYPELYATDPEWVADRLEQRIAALEKVAKAEAKRQAEGGDEDAEAEREETEREKQREVAREKAIAANLELGGRLAEKLARLKFSRDLAKVLALVAISGEDSDTVGRSFYAVRGVTMEPDDDPVGLLVDEILTAGSADEAVGLAIQAIVATRFLDPDALVRFHLRNAFLGWLGGDYGDARYLKVESMVDAFAKEAGVLPQPMLDRAEQWAREREQTREAESEEHETSIIDVIAEAGEDDESGTPRLSREQLITHGMKESISASDIDAACSRLVAAKQIEPDQGPYGLTDVGLARLKAIGEEEGE